MYVQYLRINENLRWLTLVFDNDDISHLNDLKNTYIHTYTACLVLLSRYA